MVRKDGDGPANVMCIVRGLVIGSLLLSACCSVAHAQTADKANAKAVDGFSAAVATAGATVAKAICTPLRKQDSIVLYDAASGQKLQSSCQVTGKIEEFFQVVPEQVATGVEYVANQVNDTVGFFKYMQSTASGLTRHLADNVATLDNISKNGSVDVGPALVRFIKHVKALKQSDPFCTPAALYPGVEIPTQCAGPVFELTFSGGTCTQDPDTGVVTCVQPSVSLQKTPGGCNLKYKSSDVIQDRYCAASATLGNETDGTFKHPAEIFNFQKLLSVPNPFNIDLSLYTTTAAASASPIKMPGMPPMSGPMPGPMPMPKPSPGPEPASGPGSIEADLLGGLGITAATIPASPAGILASPGNNAISRAVSGALLPLATSQLETSPEQAARALFGNFPRGRPLAGTTASNGLPLQNVASAVQSGVRDGIEAALGTRG